MRGAARFGSARFVKQRLSDMEHAFETRVAAREGIRPDSGPPQLTNRSRPVNLRIRLNVHAQPSVDP